jgi:ribosome maturation factor RimP
MHTGEEGGSGDRFFRETGVAGALAELVEPVLQDMGFRLVRVRLMGREPKIVQIMAERPDGTLTVGECESISRQLSALLDVHDPVAGNYNLEVSSPGIDRPLVRSTDFADWVGYEVKLETRELVDGRKRFRGMLQGFEDGEVRMAVDLKETGPANLGFPVDLVAEAHLVLTDDLVRESLRRGKKSQKAEEASQEGDAADRVEED